MVPSILLYEYSARYLSTHGDWVELPEDGTRASWKRTLAGPFPNKSTML
jgi:hypothetical protein